MTQSKLITLAEGQRDEEIFSTRHNSKTYQLRQHLRSKNDQAESITSLVGETVEKHDRSIENPNLNDDLFQD